MGCTAAAMLPKQARRTYRKHITTPFLQVTAPDCRFVSFVGLNILRNRNKKGEIVAEMMGPMIVMGKSLIYQRSDFAMSMDSVR